MGTLAIVSIASAAIGALGSGISAANNYNAQEAQAEQEVAMQRAREAELRRQAAVAERIGNKEEANFAANTRAQAGEMRIQGNRATGRAAARGGASGLTGTSALAQASQVAADATRQISSFRRDRSQRLDIMEAKNDERVDRLTSQAGLLDQQASATEDYYSGDEYARHRRRGIFGAVLGGGMSGAAQGASIGSSLGLTNEWNYD